LLGVSFVTKQRILMNTIFIAAAQTASQAELAKPSVMKSVVPLPIRQKKLSIR